MVHCIKKGMGVKKNKLFISLFIFLFYREQMLAMENNVPLFALPFSIEQLTECDSVRQLTITPDGKNVLIAEKKGVVSRVSCETQTKEELIEIPNVKYVPLVAVAQKEGSLLIAAAGNYIKRNNIPMAEYQIWHKGAICKYKCAPLQAIALDKQGKFLVMVNQRETVAVRNLNTDQIVIKSIWSKDSSEYDIDIVCDPEGNIIIVAKAHSIIPMKWNGTHLEVGKIHNFLTDDIKRVFFPQSNTLVYQTNTNEVKKIEITHIGNKSINAKTIFEPFLNGEINLDPENDTVAALWTRDKASDKTTRGQIIMCKKDNKTSYLYLTVAPFKNTYNYLTDQGTRRSDNNYLREVALRENSVVAVSANGILYWWLINLPSTISNKKESNLEALRELLIGKEPKGSSKETSKKVIPQLMITSSSGTSLLPSTGQTPKKFTEKSSSKRIPGEPSFFEKASRSTSEPTISPRNKEQSILNALSTGSSTSSRSKKRESSPSPSPRGGKKEEDNKK